MLTLPTSLFVKNKDDNKVIITINNSYGQHSVIVKHWEVWKTTAEDKLPPFVEYKSNIDILFDDPNVVVKEYTILDYEEEPFETGKKQYSDQPHSGIQEVEYADSIDNMYNSMSHRRNRLEWLWEEFEKIYVPGDLKVETIRGVGATLQRDLVNFYSKPIWYTWLYWRKHLLDFRGAAAELVFRREYMPREPDITEFKRIKYPIWQFANI